MWRGFSWYKHIKSTLTYHLILKNPTSFSQYWDYFIVQIQTDNIALWILFVLIDLFKKKRIFYQALIVLYCIYTTRFIIEADFYFNRVKHEIFYGILMIVFGAMVLVLVLYLITKVFTSDDNDEHSSYGPQPFPGYPIFAEELFSRYRVTEC